MRCWSGLPDHRRFGQLISNMATALIVIPIAVSRGASWTFGAPVLMAVTVAGAAAFLTPVATPANMMVMGPGGYRFGDYWKLGLPLLLLFFGSRSLSSRSSGRSNRPGQASSTPRPRRSARATIADAKTTSASPTPRWVATTRPESGRGVPSSSASPSVAAGSG